MKGSICKKAEIDFLDGGRQECRPYKNPISTCVESILAKRKFHYRGFAEFCRLDGDSGEISSYYLTNAKIWPKSLLKWAKCRPLAIGLIQASQSRVILPVVKDAMKGKRYANWDYA
jgi:hypothetical protein